MEMHPEAFADPTVRFTIPASIALDPNGFLGALDRIAEILGCGKCFSGVDCLFQRQKDFVLDASSKILPTNPVPARSLPTVDVVATDDTLGDIEGIRRLAQVAFGKLGCLPCTSGYDVLFRNTIRTLVVDERFNVRAYGRGF
jgi:hypothetical protein